MKTKIALTVWLLFLGVGASGADSSVPVSFSAQETPSACQIVAGANNTIDYGTIPRSALSATKSHQLENKAIVALSIQCVSPTSISLKATDNRSGTLSYGDLTLANGTVLGAQDTDSRFSLGAASNNQPVGVWGLVFSGATVDGNAATIYSRSIGGVLKEDSVMHKDGIQSTWVLNGSQPAVGRLFGLSGTVSAALARLSDLPSADVKLDGLVTVEVVYL